jgi:hypothetical protein
MDKSEVPRKVDSQEIIVRTVKNPNHIDSKGKLRDNLFMPSVNYKEISVLRLPYTTPNFCKKHSHKILNQERGESFHGLGIIHVETIRSIGERIGILDAADVLGSPLDENDDYIREEITVYTTDPGNPAHADIIFNCPPPEPGVPSNPIKKVAREILRNSHIKIDTNTIDIDVWTGDELVI